MSEFVSGVISGLIGAVVGGVFTAIAARAQVKAVISVAQLQIQADREAHARANFGSQRIAAADDISMKVLAMHHELQQMNEDHFFAHHWGPGDECDEPNPSRGQLRKVNEWRRQLDWISYQHADFLAAMGDEAIDRVFEHTIFGHDWEGMRGKYRTSDGCFREQWADVLSDALTDFLKKVQVERSRYH